MWYEIFKFELKYRVKRPETYVFFVFLLLFSIVGVDFVFQGVEIGLVKKNAPLVIAKTMGAITGIFMIMVSMIMGVPILRDFQYDTEVLLFINPLTKRDYLLGRFLGSFVVLLFIFSGLLFGMMLGSQMPWHKEEEMLVFNVFSYIQTFSVVVVPTLFFGACTFFVTGMLSKKLLVVYTQGIVLFVLFLLTKAITNEYLQGLFDPFSLTTLTQFSKNWSVEERNLLSISFSNILLHNKLLWSGLGVSVLLLGYNRFSFTTLTKQTKKRKKSRQKLSKTVNEVQNIIIPKILVKNDLKSKCIQLFELSKFYTFSLLKETSFWAIIICGIIIIAVNSVSLGTVYGVDSYPTTYFIIAELQEMSMYFFIILLLFYSGELVWKERTIKQYVLNDSTAIHNLIPLASKFLALVNIYIVLMLSLIVTGILFQLANGYYELNLGVYFSGFFIEILPFLILYTFITFFFQAVSKNKFIGIFLTLIFIIINVSSAYFGVKNSLYKFGGKSLGIYSEMNGYGHFLQPYLWIKMYWIVFGILLLTISSLLIQRGTETSLWLRIKHLKYEITTKPVLKILVSFFILFLLSGTYIFYNTNILNTYWSDTKELEFRANYEKKLKSLEYFPQPKITDVNLIVDLYPAKRSYQITGTYTLKNTTQKPINEIYIQKLIASHVSLKNVVFDREVVKNSKYSEFDYTIYKLKSPLQPNDIVKMTFEQSYTPKGFEDDNSDTQFVYNGTFFNNNILPTLGYNLKYELKDEDERLKFNLLPKKNKASIHDENELLNARSGGDSEGINLETIISTSKAQTAITSGKLLKKWTENDRNYFHYKTKQPIINFYSIVSADYEVAKDSWKSSNSKTKSVDLEVFYHKNHTYNIDRMLLSMKKSLSYFSTYFSMYQYEQLRIMEFPRYREFAQSFPNTIPFSEAMGFILDIDDKEDVDMAFFITAHEVAHQWFGMQIEAANVQGRNFVLETLSQYAALMVFKEQYSKQKVEQLLDLQKEIYEEKGRRATHEISLVLVENQDFVYYHKGILAMHKLTELIGEKQVNKAIQSFINDWNSCDGKIKMNTKHYATSKDLLKYFKDESTEDKHAIIHDLFETTKEM
ncbi:ABC transporter permease/M1 family aminopeptidase [Tenacibaculum sp. M341]|uniref:ABC transporter permease/M1 family aminopeptidase n=1 Tax=Tenacibaculum sp. M341 TaxID=2530339 RepID=UPI00104E2CF5|nr:M1 family aminopeptidase [Tenacibaculum sp. M341]TCI90970.1 peptidase M1 [Tenacibaculum sp. M341]